MTATGQRSSAAVERQASPPRPRSARRGTVRAGSVDKRRLILDAAVRVFARQGFHGCRVSDIADQAGVAYGLVYHYFGSKDEVLDTLFEERWAILRALIAEVDQREIPACAKLEAIAGFIIDSYRRDPELMQVIVVEVTRAVNSFGRTHWPSIQAAYDELAAIVRKGQLDGSLTSAVSAEFAALAFYGTIEQVLTGWIFDVLPRGEEHYEQARRFVVQTICGGIQPPPAGSRRGIRAPAAGGSD